jgi:hypothetical protein
LDGTNFGPTQMPCVALFYEKMLARREELMRQLDEKTAESSLHEARAWLGLLDWVDYMQHSRRVAGSGAQALGRVNLRGMPAELLDRLSTSDKPPRPASVRPVIETGSPKTGTPWQFDFTAV